MIYKKKTGMQKYTEDRAHNGINTDLGRYMIAGLVGSIIVSFLVLFVCCIFI